MQQIFDKYKYLSDLHPNNKEKGLQIPEASLNAK
jgi:hypothetical protein